MIIHRPQGVKISRSKRAKLSEDLFVDCGFNLVSVDSGKKTRVNGELSEEDWKEEREGRKERSRESCMCL